jgi:hypothetical protein
MMLLFVVYYSHHSRQAYSFFRLHITTVRHYCSKGGRRRGERARARRSTLKSDNKQTNKKTKTKNNEIEGGAPILLAIFVIHTRLDRAFLGLRAIDDVKQSTECACPLTHSLNETTIFFFLRFVRCNVVDGSFGEAVRKHTCTRRKRR